MKKVLVILGVITLTFGVMGTANVYALDLGQNITIWDKMDTGNLGDWHTGYNLGGEDQEVEPDAAHGQMWDLEGFFMKGTILSMVGGFDFEAGVGGWQSGDIFIDKDGDSAKYGSDIADQYGFNNSIMDNVFGYDYVLDLDWVNKTYDVYAIDGQTQVQTVLFSGYRESNAWRYSSGGTLMGSGSFMYNTGYTDADVGFLGDLPYNTGRHNVVTGFDMSFLGMNTDFISHFTMQCGNDNLMGDGTVVPEPGTLLLLGAGLIGLLALGRKRLNK